jgi:ATP-dependent RNA helicase DDX51/DBP6
VRKYISCSTLDPWSFTTFFLSIQTLHTRVVPRLRALIVLPTRDLARQVHEVLRPLAAAVGLCAELATGQHGAFSAEQHRLVGGDQISPEVLASLRGGSSLVDILVCTPGRLLDHLQSTPGFTLQHLEFLVCFLFIDSCHCLI